MRASQMNARHLNIAPYVLMSRMNVDSYGPLSCGRHKIDQKRESPLANCRIFNTLPIP